MKFQQIVKEKLSNLSAGQRKVANYILKNLEAFSYGTLVKISKDVAVSETTVIRLAYSLGFDSFSAMQQFVRGEILNAPQTDKDPNKNNFYGAIIAKEIHNLNQILRRTDEAYLEQVVTVIMEADMVLSAGSRAAQSSASWFANTLGHLRPNVFTLHPYMEDSFGLLAEVTKNSVLVCISFSRYSKGTYRYAKIAKDAGAALIAITDSAISPIGKLSDYLFVTNSNKDEMGFNSFVSTHCIGSLLISGVRKKGYDQIPNRLAAFEEVYKKLDVFYE
jgi:DNA-binding MurR/RpiR family transcriptional regulator